MAGISSKAAGKLENKYKFNDGTELQHQEFSDGSGFELYETPYRGYDQQLGRFWQVDPLAFFTSDVSCYAFALNNPNLRNDPTGLTDSVKTLPPVTVVGYIKPLRGGAYNGQMFNNIQELYDHGWVSSYSKTKKVYTNTDALAYLNTSKESLENIGKWLQRIGKLGGGSSLTELKSIKEFKDLLKLLKPGELKPNASMILITAALTVYMEGEKAQNGAEQLGTIVSTYIALHSTATNPNATPANGIYEITTSSVSGSTGGAGYSFSTSYYDITTKQYLGETHQ